MTKPAKQPKTALPADLALDLYKAKRLYRRRRSARQMRGPRTGA